MASQRGMAGHTIPCRIDGIGRHQEVEPEELMLHVVALTKLRHLDLGHYCALPDSYTALQQLTYLALSDTCRQDLVGSLTNLQVCTA